MKIFICTSKHNYHKVGDMKERLESAGHSITLPNSFDDPMREEKMKMLGKDEHANFKSKMLRLQIDKIANNDALLILNFEKNNQINYIGGATFLEMFKAWEIGKKIFLFNPIPEGMLKDEICAFNPVIINGDLTKIR
jgi:hypothetical protein